MMWYVFVCFPLSLALGVQTKQRHANAKALEHNARLRSENEVLRSQNAHLARELVSSTVVLI